MSANPPLAAFFQAARAGGERLYLHHTPPAGVATRGTVLYVHPWAEEMNKCRRMAALASRAMAREGWAVLQLDLSGCGDSSGDFGEATWQAWVDDVVEGAEWLALQHPNTPRWLWGVRAGALLAAEALPRLSSPCHLLLWQPATQGQTVLQQFLRIKAAAELADGGGKGVMATLRAEVAAARPLNVAGYTLGAGLYQPLQTSTLAPPTAATQAADPPQLSWLEVSAQTADQPGQAAQAGLAAWAGAGWSCNWRSVQGPAFWQTVEIEDAPALVHASIHALAGHKGEASTGAAA